MAIYYPMCLLYGFIFFPLYAWFAAGKKGVTVMAKKIFKPAITAFATQSSCAALPVNMEACDEIGVPSDISNIVLAARLHHAHGRFGAVRHHEELPSCTAFLVCPTPASAPMLCQLPSLS